MSARSKLDTHRMRRVTVRVPRGVLWRLGYAQVELGVGLSTIVRRAIVEWLERQGKRLGQGSRSS